MYLGYSGSWYRHGKLGAVNMYDVLQVPDASYESARSELGQLRDQLKKAQAAAGRPAGPNGGMATVSPCLHVEACSMGVDRQHHSTSTLEARL